MWITITMLAYPFLFLFGIHLHQILVLVCLRSRNSSGFQNRAIRSGVMGWSSEAFDSSIWALWGLAPVQFAIVSLPNQVFPGTTATAENPGTNSALSPSWRYYIEPQNTKVLVPPIIPANNFSGSFLWTLDFLQALHNIPLLLPNLSYPPGQWQGEASLMPRAILCRARKCSPVLCNAAQPGHKYQLIYQISACELRRTTGRHPRLWIPSLAFGVTPMRPHPTLHPHPTVDLPPHRVHSLKSMIFRAEAGATSEKESVLTVQAISNCASLYIKAGAGLSGTAPRWNFASDARGEHMMQARSE
jgi:hypothetical protein